MKKVLFVCHGNICRSPMAEAMFRDLVRKKGREEMFFIDSAGTSSEEYGNPMYYAAKEKLRENRIDCGNHRARTMRRDDYEKFDYLIGMDQWNIRNMTRICGGDPFLIHGIPGTLKGHIRILKGHFRHFTIMQRRTANRSFFQADSGFNSIVY